MRLTCSTAWNRLPVIEPLGHAHLGIVADVFHMALDECRSCRSNTQHASSVGHVHLADSNRRLPGQGSTDFAAILAALEAIKYPGWLSYECGNRARTIDGPSSTADAGEPRCSSASRPSSPPAPPAGPAAGGSNCGRSLASEWDLA
jgi:sugar phosphate isomerase/epimerase